MHWVIQALSGRTIDSAGTVTSDGLRTDYGRLAGFFYDLADATTGTYVSATARILVAVDSSGAYTLPVDSAGAARDILLININSNDRYISFRYDDQTVAPWTQLRIVSVTNNSITFAGAYLVYSDE